MGQQHAFRHLLTLTVLVSACCACQVSAEEENFSDWGSTAELQSPRPDSKGRSGHWWWPELPKHSDGATLIGNRGRVFASQVLDISDSNTATPEPPVPIDQGPTVCGPAYLLNNLLFKFDSVALSKEGKLETDKLIAGLAMFSGDSVVCVGHTDNVGPENYNYQLGLRRAQAVVDYMTAAGVDPKRVRAKSMGETKPAVPNDTPMNRALNRRVNFDITLGN